MKICVFIAFFAVTLCANTDTNVPKHSYPSGFRVALKIAGDLYEALPEKYRSNLNQEPVSLDSCVVPVITPIERTEANKIVRQVTVSVGFIDLLNHVSHAKAIDHIQPGYFEKYVMNLVHVNGEEFLQDPPDMVDARFWTDDVLNDQMSYFNQMVGIITAINLSHHYLGHYLKYGPKLGAGNPNQTVPINNFLSSAEWDISVKAGALNSLDTAVATEGARALFEAIGKMPRRPAWTAFIVPLNADVKKLNKKLTGYETDFFHGGLK